MTIRSCSAPSRGLAFALLAVSSLSCGGMTGARAVATERPSHPSLVDAPRRHASAAFGAAWFDGTAELSGYRITVPRYGELRTGELVLTYVTEPMNRATRIKDDDAPAASRVEVLKLNANLRFLAGIYPYSVMTSVFSPVDDWSADGIPRFSPVKITLTAQEWCGQVFLGVWPGADAFESQILSYFANEGEASRRVAVPGETLYEDALLIQLRELDGPFAGGGTFRGHVVPALFRLRRSHVPPSPVPATITRELAERDGVAVHRFVLTTDGYRRTFDVERASPHRVLGWTTSDGEDARLLDTARLAYWQLNHVGDEALRRQLGLPVDLDAPAPAPSPGVVVGR